MSGSPGNATATIPGSFTGNGDFTSIDITNLDAKYATLRLFRKTATGTPRWEVRNNAAGNFDVINVDAAGQNPTTCLTISTTGALNLPNVPVVTGTDMVVDSNGNIGKQSSSVRYKENVADSHQAFERALLLQPKSYDLKGSGQKGFGYLAEDVEALGIEDLVGYDAEGRPDSVHYKLLGIYALEILKNQQQTIAEQSRAIAALEERLQAVAATPH